MHNYHSFIRGEKQNIWRSVQIFFAQNIVFKKRIEIARKHKKKSVFYAIHYLQKAKIYLHKFAEYQSKNKKTMNCHKNTEMENKKNGNEQFRKKTFKMIGTPIFAVFI